MPIDNDYFKNRQNNNSGGGSNNSGGEETFNHLLSHQNFSKILGKKLEFYM